MTRGRLTRAIVCRKCGARHDGVFEVRGQDVQPTPGAFVLCINCGTLGIEPPEGEEVTLQPTAERYEEFLGDLHALKAMLLLRQHIAGRQS